MTQGTEIVDTGVENLRPITGATGTVAAGAAGMVQTLLGFSEQMTVNITFRIADAGWDDAAAPAGASTEIHEALYRPVSQDPVD